MQKLGILGGTFDPIHEGHIALALAAIRQAGLDGVVLLPMARPAHREADATAEDRLAMCRLAAAAEKRLHVSPAGMAPGVRYTVETLSVLRKEYPKTAFTMMIGADKLPSLPYWYDSGRLFGACEFLCFPRSGVDVQEALEKARAAGARIEMLTGFQTPCSASMIRTLTRQYQDAPGLNRRVLCYMAEHSLYQPDFLPKLKGMMNPHRFQHTLGVRKEAVKLANLHGLPIQRAALSALLHDCAKGMNLKDMRRVAEEHHLAKDENVLSSGALLHAPVGAYLAQTEFGIRDEEVLSAIRSHTVGRPGMSRLEMCIFVADATEEGREEYEGLNDLRHLSLLSLPAAVYRSFQLTYDYLMKNGNRFIDPASRKTMAYLESIMTWEEKQLVHIQT